MDKLKRLLIPRVDKFEKISESHIIRGSINWYSYFVKILGCNYKGKCCQFNLCDPAIPCLSVCPTEMSQMST